MNKFTFSFYKSHHRDGREGIFLFGKSPDHITPMEIINKFLGEKVLEINGGGVGVNLFLPEQKMDQWQKLAVLEKAWEGENQEGQKATIDLEYLMSL